MNVLIVDDHRLFADVIRAALEERGLHVVGVAGTSREATETARRERPDIVILDVGLPDASGLTAGRIILEENPDTKILALTANEDSATVAEAIRLGFHGYLTKEISARQFISSIHAVMDDQVVIPRALAGRAIAGPSPEQRRASKLAARLTAREREILGLLVDGGSSSAMAARLGISRHTLRTHIQSLLGKLEVHSRLEAATFAVKYRLLEGEADEGLG